METKTKAAIVALTLGASAWIILAQDTGGQSPPGSGLRPRARTSLVISTLDANHDGVVDAGEIANAPGALRTLDRNGDGKLTLAELTGAPPPERGGGPNNGPRPGNDPPPGPPPLKR